LALVQVNGSAANTTPVLAEGPLTILPNAVIKACGRQDGGIPSDNYLNDPRDCHFNPAVLQCQTGEDPSTCLTADEVQAAQNLYAGPTNPRTGEQNLPRDTSRPGGPARHEYSHERQSLWVAGLGADFTFDFDKDTATLDAKYDSVYNNTDPDLHPFQSRSGKTIFYQGWGDVLVNPVQQIDYYNSVVRNPGQPEEDAGFLPALYGSRDGTLFRWPRSERLQWCKQSGQSG
jgi:feruloyl esterase